jgi:hypothetical protein
MIVILLRLLQFHIITVKNDFFTLSFKDQSFNKQQYEEEISRKA